MKELLTDDGFVVDNVAQGNGQLITPPRALAGTDYLDTLMQRHGPDAIARYFGQCCFGVLVQHKVAFDPSAKRSLSTPGSPLYHFPGRAIQPGSVADTRSMVFHKDIFGGSVFLSLHLPLQEGVRKSSSVIVENSVFREKTARYFADMPNGRFQALFARLGGLGPVIFDLDGVIIDSIPVIEAAFQYACQQTYGPDVEHPPFQNIKNVLARDSK